MLIDLIFAVLMVIAIIHGYRRGLIVAIFSFVAIIIGLAAAVKLSTVAAKYIDQAVKISDKWIPIVSFIVVFILVVLLIRLGAKLIQKVTETVLLGWVNRLGGVLLYMLIYTTVFSIILFYAEQVKIIRPVTISSSICYSFIHPWGPAAINKLGSVLPFFRGMFAELELFFSGVAQKWS